MKKHFILTAGLLTYALLAFAQQTPARLNSQATQKYSAIVEADGFAFLAEDKTIKSIREEALNNAKREALERGQTYIKSVTRVENYMVTYDLVSSQSEGYLAILESKDHGIQADNRYRYWIKAEIEYKPKMPEDKEAGPAAGPLNLQIWTDKKYYTAGEQVEIGLVGNKDFYGRIVYVDADGNITQLLPNFYRKDHLFKAGVTYKIPDKSRGDLFELAVQPPFGAEQIIVYASVVNQGEVSLEEDRDGLYAFRGDLGKLSRITRGIAIKPAAGGTTAVDFFEASCQIITGEK